MTDYKKGWIYSMTIVLLWLIALIVAIKLES